MLVGGLGSAVIAVIVVVAVVILPVIAIVTVWLYKKHKSKQEDSKGCYYMYNFCAASFKSPLVVDLSACLSALHYCIVLCLWTGSRGCFVSSFT